MPQVSTLRKGIEFVFTSSWTRTFPEMGSPDEKKMSILSTFDGGREIGPCRSPVLPIVPETHSEIARVNAP